MKKALIISSVILVFLVLVFVFWEPIIDFLPIDQSGWEETEEGRFYLNEKGDPVTGWQTIDGQKYYFLPENGRLHTGWLEYPDGTYYLNESGNPLSGWQTIDGTDYYFGEAATLYSGWAEKNGKRCYLQEGLPLSGWQTIGEGRHFLDALGQPISGWADTPEGRFHLDDLGCLSIGLTQVEEGLYYFYEDGSFHTGWLQQEGLTYFFDQNGLSQTGWLERNGQHCYLKEDQTLAKGKLVIDETAYYFTSTGANIILVNPWNKLSESYTVELVDGPDGSRIAKDAKAALEKMLSDCRAAGYSPYVASSYRSVSTQQYLLDKKVREWMDKGYNEEAAYYYATRIVAVPGTSEHHLGYAVDIIDSAYTILDASQADRPTQKWLMEHCWEYGFIMRYPANTTDITGIIYEPWHYRYVGTELALEMKELEGVCLETYLDNLTGDGTTCGGKYVKLEEE